ncbi:Hpt domain-containing protein [Sulfurimonas sp.]|nr:Hpt domain-containing protein [Sulfurimonas sp.]
MPILTADYSVLNHEEMAASIGLKAKHIPMLVGSFLEESAPLLESLEGSINNKDYAEIKAGAHSIKGSAGNLRFTEIYEMAKEMEFAGTDQKEDFDFAGYLDAIKKAVSTISI